MTSSTVLVTGAGQGIGRVLAHDLAGRGWRVVVADLAGDRAATVVEEIAAKGGLAEAVTVDVADADSCRAVAAEVEARHGALDGLVNNAALFSTLTMKPFWEIPDDEWDRVLRVNLTGLWLITRALLPALRQAPAASIVNISASAVWIGRPNYAHYVASKAGGIGLTYVMARELGELGIRVNAVTPGSVATEIPRHTVTAAQRQSMTDAQCVRRPATPEDLAGTVAFLLGRDSAFISGQTVNVDGGLTVR